MLLTTSVRLITICSLVLITGCASLTSLVDAIPRTVDPALADSPYYPSGYSDGCNTAVEAEKSFSAKITQDVQRFSNDKGYAYGWRQGLAACAQSNIKGNQNPYQ